MQTLKQRFVQALKADNPNEGTIKKQTAESIANLLFEHLLDTVRHSTKPETTIDLTQFITDYFANRNQRVARYTVDNYIVSVSDVIGSYFNLFRPISLTDVDYTGKPAQMPAGLNDAKEERIMIDNTIDVIRHKHLPSSIAFFIYNKRGIDYIYFNWRDFETSIRNNTIM